MLRTKISSTDLNWIFQAKLKGFDDYPFHGIPIAIVPDPEHGWMAVMTQRDRKFRPEWVERIEVIQKQLQRSYALARD
jgi:hypothetical protein